MISHCPTKLSSNFPDITLATLSWLPPARLNPKPDPNWLKWLLDLDSLTQLLIAESEGEFSVDLVEEKWCCIESANIRKYFGPVSESHRFWSRKVILKGRQTPWVMAHTLVPEHSLHGPMEEVRRLNIKPLGEYLFSQPDLYRSSLEITEFEASCWGRRSLFFLSAKPIMVAEFFLPALIGPS